jgi:hypothetical protein
MYVKREFKSMCKKTVRNKRRDKKGIQTLRGGGRNKVLKMENFFFFFFTTDGG